MLKARRNCIRRYTIELLEMRTVFSADLGYRTAADAVIGLVPEQTLNIAETAEEVYGPNQSTILSNPAFVADVQPASSVVEIDVYTAVNAIATASIPSPAIEPHNIAEQHDEAMADSLFATVGSLLIADGDDSGNDASPSLTPDQQQALELCGDDTDCRQALLNLFDIIDDAPAPPWFSIETITFGGRCVWWTTHCHSDILDAEQGGTDLGGIGITEDWRHYIGLNPLWREHHYLTVTLPNGNIFYMDVYWLGGSDHIFFELPPSLVDDAGYAEYWERCTAAMDGTMH